MDQTLLYKVEWVMAKKQPASTPQEKRGGRRCAAGRLSSHRSVTAEV
jgi:hypothetical protein